MYSLFLKSPFVEVTIKYVCRSPVGKQAPESKPVSATSGVCSYRYRTSDLLTTSGGVRTTGELTI